MSKFFNFFVLCICFIAQELFSMEIMSAHNNYEKQHKKNENPYKKPYIESPLATYIKQKNVVLPKESYRGYPITFEKFQEAYITHYLLNGKPVAKLVQIDDDMYFESRHKQIYDFILQSYLNIGSLTIDTNGKYAFQKPINAYSAYIESKTVNFFDTFSSKSGLSIETGCCSNHSDIECSNILFKGNYFKNRSNSTVLVNQSAIFSSEKILNNGNMQYGQDALINTSYYENFGVMHAYNLCLHNNKIFFNKGTVDIDGSFRCKSEFFDHQGILTVNNNCTLEKIGTLSTSESSEWHVGKDWKAYVTHLYLRGYADTKNLDIISNDINLLKQSRLGINTGSFKAKEDITNAGQLHVADKLEMDARKIKLEKTSVIKAKNADFMASQAICNKGILTIIEHWLAHAKLLSNSGLIQVDTGHIKADLFWLNIIFGIVQTKNGLTIDALESLNILSLTQAHNITLNTGIAINLLGFYKAKNININSLFDSKPGLFFLPKINSFSELYSKENILNISKGLFFKAVPFCGLMYSLFNNIRNIYSNSQSLYSQTRSLYGQKNKGISDIIALACGIKNIIMSGKQINDLRKQNYQVLSKFKDVDNYQEATQKIVQDAVVTPIKNVASKIKDIDSFQKVTQAIQDITLPIKNNLKEISEDIVAEIVPHVNSDTVIDFNGVVIGGINHSNSIYNTNVVLSLFFQNKINTRNGNNLGYLGAYNLNINASDSYYTWGSIKAANTSIETKRLIVDGKVNTSGITQLKGKEYVSVGANIKTQQIGIQSDANININKKAVMDTSNMVLDSQEVHQHGIVNTKDLTVDAHLIDNHGTTETSTMRIIRSKPREYNEYSTRKNGLFNHGILTVSDFGANVETVKLDKESQFNAKEAYFKSDFDFENNGQMNTEQGYIEIETENQVTNTGNINSKELRIIKAKNVSCTKTSTIVSQDAFIKADENVLLDGITQIGRGTVDANGKATIIGKLGASEQLEMRAKDILFGKTANVNAKIADLKANETINQEGNFLSSVLLTHSKYMTNSGKITSENAHIKADRYFYNKWEGQIKVHKELTIDTLILLNLFGYIDAEQLNTNSIIDINLYGIYRASSLNMNSIIGYNRGLLFPKFQSLQKMCTSDNIKRLFENLRDGAPLIWIYNKITNIPDSIDKYCKNVQCLWKRAQELYANENTCASEVVPLLCQINNMLISAILTGYQGYQMSQDFRNKESSSQSNNYVPGSVADLWQTEKNNAIAHIVSSSYSKDIITAAASVFGPQLARNSLLDVNSGRILGINGSSQSLYNVNSGTAYFANNYSLNTLSGVNSGSFGANNLCINAYQTYTNTGLCSGINSFISANDLYTTGTIYAFNNAVLRARNNAIIDRNIKASQIAINAKHVQLKKDAHIMSQISTYVKADKIVSQATVRSNSVNFDGKEVSLQKGSDIKTHGDIDQIIIKAGKSLEASKDSSIIGNFVKIDAPNVDIDHSGFLKANKLDIDGKNIFASESSHIESQNGEFNIGEKTVNAGTLVLQNMTLNTKELKLTETSNVKLNNVQADVSETIHNAGIAQINNSHIKSNNIETAETSNVSIDNSVLNNKEKIVNAGVLALQDSVVNTKELKLTETSNAVLNNVQANVIKTIHNAGAAKINNSYIKSNNIETAETSNVSIDNSVLNNKEKIVNAGALALQDSVVNTKETILTDTSNVVLNNVQAHVDETIHNAGAAKINNSYIKSNNIETTKTSNVSIDNSVLNNKEKIVNAGALALQDSVVNTKEAILTETSNAVLNNVQANVIKTIHNAGAAKINNSYIKSNNIETAETSNVSIDNSVLNNKEKIVNAGALALQDSIVNTKETILTNTSNVVLNNVQAHVNEAIHNAGVVDANNVCIKTKNIEAAETSNVSIAHSELNIQEKIVNAGALALQDSVVNTKELKLTETSDVKLNNVQADVSETIHNAGVVDANNVSIKSKNIETAETSNVSIDNSVLNNKEKIVNDGTLILKNSAINSQELELTETSNVHVNNVQAKVDKTVNNKGNVDVSEYFLLQAQCIDNSGTVEGDTIITKADCLNLRKTSKINANIFSNDIKEIHGEEGNTIAVQTYASMKTNYLDNDGSIQGPLVVEFNGNPDDLKRIGQIEKLQYSGTVENNIPDKLADGNNDLLNVKSIVTIVAEEQKVHLKEEHAMPHTFQAIGKEVQCDKKLSSEGSMWLVAKQNLQHDSVISKGLTALIGKNIISSSHIEREYDGENYEDKCKKNIVKGHTVLFQTEEDVKYIGVEVESDIGGTHGFVGGKLYCDSLELEKYVKSESTTKSLLGFEKTMTTVEDIYKQQEETKFKSKGVNNINVGEKSYLSGTIFEAKDGTTINNVEYCPIYDMHIHKEETKTKYKAFNKKINKETTYKESISVEEKPLAFLEEVTPVINSNEKVLLSFICNAAKIIINAPEANYILPKNIKTTTSFKDKMHGLMWNRVTQDDLIDVIYGPKYTGVIETDAQKIHIEGIQGCSTTRVKATTKNAEIIRSKIEEKHENKKTVLRSRPTKPLMFAICFAVSVATANVGGSLGSGIAALSNSKVAISLLPNLFSSGLSSLSTQTTQILLNSDGNIKQAMHQCVSKDTFKNLLVSILSSGAMVGVEHVFNKAGLQPINSGPFIKRCISQAPKQLTHAGIKTAADMAMGKDPKKAVKDNLKLSLANIVGIAASGCIGDAYIDDKISPVTHKILHTGVGALEGFIINKLDGAIAGAIGAGVTETIADVFKPKLPSLDYINQLERERGSSLTQEEFMYEWNFQIARYLKNTYTTAEAAKFIGATTALLAQQDMNIAYNAAEKAIDNNFLVLATYGIAGASAAYSAYQIYNAYQEKGAEAAFNKLGIEIIHNTAGLVAGRAAEKVLFKVGGILYPSVEAAVITVLDASPGLKYTLSGLKDKLIDAGKKLAQTTVGKKAIGFNNTINKIETKILETEQKVVEKVSKHLNSCAENIVEQVVPSNVLSKVEGQLAEQVMKKGVIQVDSSLISIIHGLEKITTAIAKIEINRINHILTPKTGKHAWNKIVIGEVTWEKVKPIIEKVMLEGTITKIEENIITKSLDILKETVEVQCRILNDTFSIVNSWVKTR